MNRRLLLLGLLAAVTTASAQTVYRCGPDGREYQSTPCPNGQPVNVADPRGEAQRREAAQLSQREAALAQQLRREQASTGGATVVQPPPRPGRMQPEAESAKPPARHHGKRRHPLGPDERLTRTPKANTPKKKPKTAAATAKS